MPQMPSEESLEVLLVDDELSTREILEQFCRSRNLAVTVASDGRAAMTALERNPSRFTIILTDINMPGADGFEVLKAAKAVNRECYVVMITGYATLDSALRAVREGAYDYLAKPFSLGQLDVMLARIKDRIGLERENRDLRRRLQGKGGAPGRSRFLRAAVECAPFLGVADPEAARGSRRAGGPTGDASGAAGPVARHRQSRRHDGRTSGPDGGTAARGDHAAVAGSRQLAAGRSWQLHGFAAGFLPAAVPAAGCPLPASRRSPVGPSDRRRPVVKALPPISSHCVRISTHSLRL